MGVDKLVPIMYNINVIRKEIEMAIKYTDDLTHTTFQVMNMWQEKFTIKNDKLIIETPNDLIWIIAQVMEEFGIKIDYSS